VAAELQHDRDERHGNDDDGGDHNSSEHADNSDRSDERGDRGPREESPQGDASVTEAGRPTETVSGEGDGADADTPRRPRYPTGFATEDGAAQEAPRHEGGASQPEAPEHAQSPAPAPARTAPAPATDTPPARAGLPKVQPFNLSVTDLEQIATSSGLQWVNSDADKVAAVQAAIAAEPIAKRVLRERPPAVVVNEGPLVLVETRKDLNSLQVPF
jgi:ribonuclease E